MEIIGTAELNRHFASIECMKKRTPCSTDEDKKGSFKMLKKTGNVETWIGWFSGVSDWEKHPEPELVVVVEGIATLIELTCDGMRTCDIRTGDEVMIDARTWRRFDAKQPIKLLTVTPTPTEHSVTEPETYFA